MEKNYFIRNFGDEFIAVKRKGYYLCVYVGRPLPNEAGDINRLRKIQDSATAFSGEFQRMYANRYHKGDISKMSGKQPVEGNANADRQEFQRLYVNRSIIGYSGGNIALLWSKDYGTSVLGYNVAPTTRHGLIFTDPPAVAGWVGTPRPSSLLTNKKGCYM